MLLELSREAPKLVENLAANSAKPVEVRDKTTRKVLLFAADNIELEWPQEKACPDLSDCLNSTYFFS